MHKLCKWRDHVVSALSVGAWLCVSNWVKVEQRVEPAKKAAQVLHKKLQGCMQSQQGLDAEKRMVLKVLSPLGGGREASDWLLSGLHLLLSPQKKLPLMLLSISMAESLKDFDADSSIRWQVWSSAVHPSIHPSIHALDLTANNWLQSCEKPHDCSTLAFSFGWKGKRIPLTVYNLWPLSLVMSFIWNVRDPPAFL